MKLFHFLPSLLACLFLPCPAQASGKSKLAANLEAGKPQVVVAYGTSLTAGGAWVRGLQAEIDKQFPGLCKVVNSGGSGQWSKWGVENLQGKVLAKNPDTVIIEFSINDAVARFHGSVEIARKNLETMANRILAQNPSCEIILMTMTPGNKYAEGHRSYRLDVESHYAMYRVVAKERGFLLVDHYPVWKAMQENDRAQFDKYVPDTIHPTAEGCDKVVAPAVLAALGFGRKAE
jgi:acyl-CoA thioesterase-1